MTDSRTWIKVSGKLSDKDESEIIQAMMSNKDLVYVRIENEREVRLSFVPNYVTVEA